MRMSFMLKDGKTDRQPESQTDRETDRQTNSISTNIVNLPVKKKKQAVRQTFPSPRGNKISNRYILIVYVVKK